MNKQGYLHTADILLLLLFSFLLLIATRPLNISYPDTLYPIQQMHDLISVWEFSGGISNLPKEEAESDILFMFPNSTYELRVGQSVHKNGGFNNLDKILSVESFFIDDNLAIKSISLAIQMP